MCGLCSSDPSERDKERRAMHNSAERLRRLAKLYDGLASGEINPHSEKAKDVGLAAKSVIRFLVDEWV